MKITKNKREGYVINGQKDLVLTQRNYWLDNRALDDSDFKYFRYQLNCKKRKVAVLWSVVKFLFSK